MKPCTRRRFLKNRGEALEGRIFLGITGNQPAQHNAAVKVHALQNFVHDFAADVFVIDVDAFGRGRG